MKTRGSITKIDKDEALKRNASKHLGQKRQVADLNEVPKLKKRHSKKTNRKRSGKNASKVYFEKPQYYDLTIKTLSPVHIGDGNDLDPLSYVIRGGSLYRFDTNKIVRHLIQDAQLQATSSIWEQLDKFVEFMKSKADYIIEGHLYESKAGLGEDIVQEYAIPYGTIKSSDGAIDQMLIASHISTNDPKTHERTLFIPGSSLKGALLSALTFDTSQRQMLKLSDAIATRFTPTIGWSVRVGEKGSIYQKVETIPKGVILHSRLIKVPSLQLTDIISKLEHYYQKADDEQYQRYKNKVIEKNQFLLRIGKYKGLNFINPDLPAREMSSTKAYFKFNKNDDEQAPFGWLLCTFKER